MAWEPTPAGPRNLREFFHWTWEQFKRVGRNIGDDEGTPPTAPPDPPTVPSPGPGAHSHYIENLINVLDSPVAVTRQVLAFDGVTLNYYQPEYRLNWRNPYAPGDTYYTHDVVFDGGWTMVANKTTTDRAAPQPSGDPTWNYPTPPTWVTQNYTGVVRSGHLYTFTASGWFNGVRVWVPQLTADTNYQFIFIQDPNGPNPIITVITEPVLVENDWTLLATANTLVIEGQELLVVIDALNSGGSTPTTGGWNYAGQNQNEVDPGSQAWNTNNQETILRINETDLDTNNRETELLGIIAGSTIRFSESIDPTNFREYRVNADPVDQGTYIQFPDVTLLNSQGTLPLGATDMDASTPIAQPTQYVDVAGYWPTNNPTWADIDGFLQLDGVTQPGTDAIGYGMDVLFQEGSRSPDWDVMAMSEGVGGSSGGGGGIAGTANFRATRSEVTTTDNTWTVIRTRTVPVGGGYRADIQFDAKRTDGVNYYTSIAVGLVWNDAGTINIDADELTELGETTLNTRLVATGNPNEFALEVQGRNAQTWEWDCLELYREVD